jgi:peptide-methionine (S)-S-oxide reductase
MIRKRIIVTVMMALVLLTSCTFAENGRKANQTNIQIMATDTATFGAGCFWCVEAVFSELRGVEKVVSGYAGGSIPNPTYKEVCSGLTGHAEVCQVHFDPDIISYSELLEVFWQTHDPTTLNLQGADIGSQYRSVIFFHNDEQERLAGKYKEELGKAGIWQNPVVTEISPFSAFYKAEDYHQDYYSLNSGEGYCQMVITPKLEKFRKVFRDKLNQP